MGIPSTSQMELKQLFATAAPSSCQECLLFPCICDLNDSDEDLDLNQEPQDNAQSDMVESKFDDETKEPKESILVSKLQPHQHEGMKFLLSALNQNTGAILADFMGLGKTLQILVTLDQYCLHIQTPSRNQRILILCPTICLPNWEMEYHKWYTASYQQHNMPIYSMLLQQDLERDHSTNKRQLNPKERRYEIVKQWHSTGGILLLGYELYRLLVTTSTTTKSPTTYHEMLRCPGPDIVVLDEAHRIKDASSQLYQTLMPLATPRRLLVTGYPIQNRLVEYWNLIQFVRPQEDHLNFEMFQQQFQSNPQATKERLASVVLRRSMKLLCDQLRPKTEWIIFCGLTKTQHQLQEAFLEHQLSVVSDESVSESTTTTRTDKHPLHTNPLHTNNVFLAHSTLLQIINHPDLILRESRESSINALEELATELEEEEAEDQWTYTPVLSSSGGKTKEKVAQAQQENQQKYTWVQSMIEMEQEPENQRRRLIEGSGKMKCCYEIIKSSLKINDKVILFSQSLATLSILGQMIEQEFQHTSTVEKGEKTRKVEKERDPRRPFQPLKRQRLFKHQLTKPPTRKPLTPCKLYCQLDGKTSQKKRKDRIRDFNDPQHALKIILISTRAGAEGINLHGGNRVILYDINWNPCHDYQAMCRSHRLGQRKSVFVYRLIGAGTIECQMFQLQFQKQQLSRRILDEDHAEVFSIDSETLSMEEHLECFHQQFPILLTHNSSGEQQSLPDETLDLTLAEFYHDQVLMNVLQSENGQSSVLQYQTIE